MKRYLLILVLIFTAKYVKADYGNMSLSELICEADYGVIGKIVKIDDNYFYIKVDSCILGRVDRDTIPIIKFKNWPCAKRYSEYEVGQREIVFFKRSNYVIDDYEFLGYGGGDEFELPITNDSIINYQAGYDTLVQYNLPEFIRAVKDYAKLKEKIDGTSKAISKGEQAGFSLKSPLHKLFIECKKRTDYNNDYEDDEMPKMGVIADIEKRYLYTDYDNKVRIVFSGTKPVKFYIKVDDADVRRVKDYYIVKPKSGWTRRFINVYKEGTDSILFNQIFEVIDLPEPRIYFGDHYWTGDTVQPSSYRRLLPSVHHYLDDLHYEENLEYKLLSFDYIIKSGKSLDTIHCKTEWGSHTFHERIKQIKNGDIVEVTNAYVQYPNNVVVKLKGRKVYIKMTAQADR